MKLIGNKDIPLKDISSRDIALIQEKYGDGEESEKALKKVISGEPLAYVLGEWYFYGLTFRLNSDCLIPRPDTEHIVDAAIKLIPKNGIFADLCTGCGCIAISVLKNRPDLKAYALDISDKALEAAEENAKANGIASGRLRDGNRLELIAADIFRYCPENQEPDAVISNPPYIKTDVIPTLETVKHEPVIALDGGKDGLDFYRHILKLYKNVLKKNGFFIFEIGYDEGQDIIKIARENQMRCSITKDYGGNDRTAIISGLSE